MFEPTIKTDITNLPKTIETNLDELAPFIKEKVDNAKSLVVEASSIEQCEMAEADASLLSKLSKRVKEFRLTWTAQWNSPFETVIAKCKEYERSLDDAASDLRSKAKVGRDLVREKKCEELRGVWEDLISKRLKFMGTEPHFKRFFELMTNEKTKGCWTNRGKKVEKCIEEMTAELDRCEEVHKQVFETVDDDKARVIALQSLGEHFDLAESLSAVNQYRRQQEMIRAAEEARKAREEAARKEEKENVLSAPAEAPAPVSDAPATTEPPRVLVQDAPLETYRLAVTGTRKDLCALRAWGKEHGIVFKNLDR